jgi:hypothetical protein
MMLPRTSSYDGVGCGLSPILHEKSKGCGRIILQTIDYFEGHLLCLS